MAARLALAAAATQPAAVTLSARSSLMITRRECSRRCCREGGPSMASPLQLCHSVAAAATLSLPQVRQRWR